MGIPEMNGFGYTGFKSAPAPGSKMSPDIYQYDDFRAFLKESFEAKVRAEVEAGRKYSQRGPVR